MRLKTVWIPGLLALALAAQQTSAQAQNAQQAPLAREQFGQALSRAVKQPPRELRAVTQEDSEPAPSVNRVTDGITPLIQIELEDDEDDSEGGMTSQTMGVTNGIRPGGESEDEDDEAEFERDVEDYGRGFETNGVSEEIGDVEWEFEEDEDEDEAAAAPRESSEPSEPTTPGDIADFNGLRVTRMRFESQAAAEQFEMPPTTLQPRYALDGEPAAFSSEPAPAVYEQRGAWLLAVSGEAVLDPELARRALAAGWAGLGEVGPVNTRMVHVPDQGLAIRTSSNSPALVEAYEGVVSAKAAAGDTTTQVGIHDGERRIWYVRPGTREDERAAFAAYTRSLFKAPDDGAPKRRTRNPTVGINGRLQGR